MTLTTGPIEATAAAVRYSAFAIGFIAAPAAYPELASSGESKTRNRYDWFTDPFRPIPARTQIREVRTQPAKAARKPGRTRTRLTWRSEPTLRLGLGQSTRSSQQTQQPRSSHQSLVLGGRR